MNSPGECLVSRLTKSTDALPSWIATRKVSFLLRVVSTWRDLRRVSRTIGLLDAEKEAGDEVH